MDTLLLIIKIFFVLIIIGASYRMYRFFNFKDNLTRLGFGITAIIILIVLIFILFKFNSFINMEPNEFGDFIAGIASAMALIWLIIAYFQQNKELKLNTKALELQYEELKHQVEETAKIAKNAERQADATEQLAFVTKNEAEIKEIKELAELQPIFKPSGGRSGTKDSDTKVDNLGGLAKNITVKGPNNIIMTFSNNDYLDSGQSGQLSCKTSENNLNQAYPFEFTVEYEDKLNNKHTKRFRFTEVHKFEEII